MPGRFPAAPRSLPRAADDTIFEELASSGTLTVTDNVFLGRELVRLVAAAA